MAKKPRHSTKSRAKATTRDKAPHGMGRLPVEVDMEQLDTLARIGCTYDEIAAVLKVHRDTLGKRWGERIQRLRQEGRSSLRRAQWTAALKGNPTMLIWLGKNELNQTDKQEWHGHMDVFANMTNEELLQEIQRQLASGGLEVPLEQLAEGKDG